MSALLPATVSAPGEAFPTPEEVLHQLDTLVSSPQLRESHQLQAFLEYIVKESLAGRQVGPRRILVLQHLGAAERVEADRLHRTAHTNLQIATLRSPTGIHPSED